MVLGSNAIPEIAGQCEAAVVEDSPGPSAHAVNPKQAEALETERWPISDGSTAPEEQSIDGSTRGVTPEARLARGTYCQDPLGCRELSFI
jgi:hypothetical protein